MAKARIWAEMGLFNGLNMKAKLSVKVITRSSQNQLVSWDGETLKVKLRAVPIKGQANEALIELFAELLDLSKSQITIATGESSNRKTLLIEGIAQEDLFAKLLPLLVK